MSSPAAAIWSRKLVLMRGSQLFKDVAGDITRRLPLVWHGFKEGTYLVGHFDQVGGVHEVFTILGPVNANPIDSAGTIFSSSNAE
jgi:hypothetical protein